jgi:hypothetical protein
VPVTIFNSAWRRVCEMELPKYAGLLRGRHFLNTDDFTQEEIK